MKSSTSILSLLLALGVYAAGPVITKFGPFASTVALADSGSDDGDSDNSGHGSSGGNDDGPGHDSDDGDDDDDDDDNDEDDGDDNDEDDGDEGETDDSGCDSVSDLFKGGCSL